LQARHQLLIETPNLFVLLILGQRQINLEAEQVIGAKPRINVQQLLKAPEEQSGANHHDDC